VRLASARAARRLSCGCSRRVHSTLPLLLVALHACVFGAACRPHPASADVRIESTVVPAPPAVGAATLTLRLLDRSGKPIRGAKLEVEAHMSHPGMAPVVVQVTERSAGLYEAPLQFTMPGDWIVLVSGSLAGGEAVRHRIDVRGVQ
jgi:hypothetical protein